MNIEFTYDDDAIMQRINDACDDVYDDDDTIELFDVPGNVEIFDDEMSQWRIAALANDDVNMYIETFLLS